MGRESELLKAVKNLDNLKVQVGVKILAFLAYF